jgi:hypothetical protein
VDTGTLYDGNAEGRITTQLFLGTWGYCEAHYEIVLSGGDTRRRAAELERLFPELSGEGFLVSPPLEDDRRLMDLTSALDDDDTHLLYHRLDRLSLTVRQGRGTLRLGRQAVTWGNGLLFNPMDLFNPFSPTDIERDYKVGDDMVSAQFHAGTLGEVQLLYVPRRNPSNRKLAWNQSSLAGKLHFASGTTEFDIMAAGHYGDAVAAFGSSGYLGGAAWRLDLTWSSGGRDPGQDGYLSLVANVDYSWVWAARNCYGFVEIFYSGLGEDNYTEAVGDPEIRERLDRGELFTLGRTYLAGHLRVELHPLFNGYVTLISNLADPSGIVQPRAIWDISKDVQITVGTNLFFGRRGTEYGGFRLPGAGLRNQPPNSAFLWCSYFF